MKKIGTVKILDVKYDIFEDLAKNNYKLEDSNAYVELYSKKIILATIEKNKLTIENIAEFDAIALRHEIIHAFFYECGLLKYSDDETLVDFMAHQLLKIKEICENIKIEGKNNLFSRQ